MPRSNNKSLLVIGECMMELAEDGDAYKRAFAGDTYNSAVYAKRRHEGLDVQILTAVGRDPISKAMRAQWDRDRIGHGLVATSESAHPGIYAISTDESGERSFSYWRKASAATEFMSLMTRKTRRALTRFDCIYFSGITLAILPDEDKAALLTLMGELDDQGTAIAFDPNYRAVLWQDVEQAKEWLTHAYSVTNIALPGLADHQAVFGHQDAEDVSGFLQHLCVDEIVLKAEGAGVFGYQNGQEPVHQAFTPQPNPRDTTGAGDSFAGTYLAERLAGASMPQAMQSAAKVASLVVQHRGAIVDEGIYREFMQENP